MMRHDEHLEHKFARFGEDLTIGAEADDMVVISGYASLFGCVDGGGDLVQTGAYQASLDRLSKAGIAVKMLWQHDPAQPIGVWDVVREDARGLHVKGRILTRTQKGAEAAALIAVGALDGLSIGYRTRRATARKGGGRCLAELDLWEVSLVTFPMLPTARVTATAQPVAAAKSTSAEPDLSDPDETPQIWREVIEMLRSGASLAPLG
ncbi:putative gene transfer agent prohead protease [Phaeobacter inhibens]|nr:putative gene transfer agent prohead protease [Phaeobacter inhibens]AUQ78482.1 putative gene transfer agent prohead protease [Phaeobacter inhibens]AUR15641.1 putative gene transfer agent prohead protease [Phaeobacter inhibens]